MPEPFAGTASGLTRTRRRRPAPCLDRFGVGVSIIVLIAAAAAVFVVRQNLDDHVYSLTAMAQQSETTGAAAQ